MFWICCNLLLFVVTHNYNELELYKKYVSEIKKMWSSWTYYLAVNILWIFLHAIKYSSTLLKNNFLIVKATHVYYRNINLGKQQKENVKVPIISPSRGSHHQWFGVVLLEFSMSLCIQKKKRSCCMYCPVTCFFQLIDCGSLCTPLKMAA